MNVNATAVNKTTRGLLLTRRRKRRGSARKKIGSTARFATIRRISLMTIAVHGFYRFLSRYRLVARRTIFAYDKHFVSVYLPYINCRIMSQELCYLISRNIYYFYYIIFIFCDDYRLYLPTILSRFKTLLIQ